MERDITSEYTEYMYNNFYDEETDWDEYYERMAIMEDMERDELYGN